MLRAGEGRFNRIAYADANAGSARNRHSRSSPNRLSPTGLGLPQMAYLPNRVTKAGAVRAGIGEAKFDGWLACTARITKCHHQAEQHNDPGQVR